ncbi:MAG: hypothetical protein HOV66_11050 [Streptomycetaceae bacterium]|nr:hypothetical protein [Streptomycetaceae bacterium]
MRSIRHWAVLPILSAVLMALWLLLAGPVSTTATAESGGNPTSVDCTLCW